ncbi:MAG: radical SAM protein [Lachnospiraceae bacterium]|nr:radical SAM protein [Lachnospiraceae bacterium]
MLFNVWVTTACNLKCKYCYEGNHANGMQMSEETAMQVLNYMYHKIEGIPGYIVVNYHGGEPLLNYEIVHFMTEALKERFPNKKILFGITTNAILLDKDKMEYLSENFFYNLSISIDGGRQIHDRNRITIQNSGTYNTVIKNIYPLLSRRKDLRARMTYTPDTVGSLFESVKNVVDLGFRIVVPVPNYSDDNWTEEHAEILEYEICKMYHFYGNKEEVHISLLSPDFQIAKGKCNAGTGEINIDCQGKIYPCTCMVNCEKYQLGNVLVPAEQKTVRFLEEADKADSECEGCGLEHWCVGARCKLVNKILTGSYGSPPAFLCAETNALYKAYCRFGGRGNE